MEHSCSPCTGLRGPPVLPRRNAAQILSRTDHPSTITLQKTTSHHEMAMITNGISMRGVRVDGYNLMLQMALIFPEPQPRPKRRGAPRLFPSANFVLQLPAPYTSVGEKRGHSPKSTGEAISHCWEMHLDDTRLLMNETASLRILVTSQSNVIAQFNVEGGGQKSVYLTTPIFHSYSTQTGINERAKTTPKLLKREDRPKQPTLLRSPFLAQHRGHSWHNTTNTCDCSSS